MAWDFKVGQKVVCVDASRHPTNNRGLKMLLREKEIYTISRTYVDKEGRFLVGLEGLPLHDGSGSPLLFLASRFRPLVTDTQPWLAQLLAPSPHQKEPTKEGRKMNIPDWMAHHG